MDRSEAPARGPVGESECSVFSLTKRHFDGFSAGQQDDFQHRAAAYLRLAFPAETKPLTDPQLDLFIRGGVERARTFDIRCERDVYRFLELQVLFGPKFDVSPEAPWAPLILPETGIGSAARLDLLFAAAAWQLRAGRAQMIAPANLRASCVQVAFDALWKAHLYLAGRRLSLGALDLAERTEWLSAFDAALVGVEPVVAPLAESPAGPEAPVPPAGEQAIGVPFAKPQTNHFKKFDLLCWNEVTAAVANSPDCIAAMDRWILRGHTDAMIAEQGEPLAWQRIAESRTVIDPEEPTTAARIAQETTRAIAAVHPMWIRDVTPIDRDKPFDHTATLLDMKADQAWVFDWCRTLNPYEPRLVPQGTWRKGG